MSDMNPAFAELLAKSSFSFLEGASHPEQMVEAAHAAGLSAIALCDRHGLYGSVRAHAAGARLGQRVVVGAAPRLSPKSKARSRCLSWTTTGTRTSASF